MTSAKWMPRTQSERFFENLGAFAAAGALFLFTYFFFEVYLLVFGAVLIAVLLTLIAGPLCRLAHLHRFAAILISTLLLAGLVGLAAYLFGSRLATDLQDVVTRMTSAQDRLKAALSSSELGRVTLQRIGEGGSIPIVQIATSVFSISANVLAGAVVAFVAGIYLAAQPDLYLNGMLVLFPKERRAHAEETVVAVGNALCRWVEGQFVSMLLVGVLSALAAYAIGLPSPTALGLIAGLTEFIPYVGPILGAIPMLLVAATQDHTSVLWALAAYVLIQFLESYMIAPLVQRNMVFVPPAIMLLGIAAMSMIFGRAAVVFAAPTVVVIFVLVSKLYVRDKLGEDTQLPGEESRQ